MSAFFNKSAFIKEFNQALNNGFKFTLDDEEGEETRITSAEQFIELSADYEICFLNMTTPSNKSYFIGFTSEYSEEIEGALVKYFDYTDNKEFLDHFKEFLQEE